MPKSPFLLQKLQTPRNLRSAWKELNKSNRHSHGLSQETIEDFDKNLDQNLSLIRKQLKQKEYIFSPVRAAVIVKRPHPGKLKKRGIRVAEIRDRVVQRGIARIIEPILNKQYDLRNKASFAYLKDRGPRKALKRMVLLYKKQNPVVFEADIKKFFNTVNRKQLLRSMVFPKLPDSSLNNLIENGLSQEIGNWNALSSSEQELFLDSGIPQGGGLSPLLANVYLSSFDKKMLESGFGLVRYADDFIVMCKDKDEATKAYDLSQKILESELGLKMHNLKKDGTGKTRIVRISQSRFEFLGVRYNGTRLWPSKKRVQNLKMRIREITEFSTQKTLLNILSEMKYLVEGWISAYCYTKMEPYLKGIEEEIKRRVGVSAYRMGWSGKPFLSNRQRRFSGIPDILTCLKRQRRNLSKEDRLMFEIGS